MIIRKAYKFKLKTNPEVAQLLTIFSGHSRFAWNYFWRINKLRLHNKQKIMRYHEMNYWLTLLKQSEEYGFLAEAPAHVLQQKLKDLDKAYKDGFDKKQPNKRMPKLRKKLLHNSFRYPEPKQFKIDNNRLYLPKIGWVGFFKSRNIIDDLKNLTITKQGDSWFCSIQIQLEQEIEQKSIISQNSVGIDVGIAKFAALSNGEYIEPRNPLKALQNKLSKAQQVQSNKEKFSNNWRRCVKKVQTIHNKIKNVRLDFLHKETTKISKNHALVVIEELKIKNMSKSSGGNIDTPGKNVKAKSGLNKSILDQGWGIFRSQLEYKLQWNGGELRTVSPHHTSQRCSKCGYVDSGNRTSQDCFVCISCNHSENADINAAKNILAIGQIVSVCGENALAISMKQKSLGIGDLVPTLQA